MKWIVIQIIIGLACIATMAATDPPGWPAWANAVGYVFWGGSIGGLVAAYFYFK